MKKIFYLLMISSVLGMSNDKELAHELRKIMTCNKEFHHATTTGYGNIYKQLAQNGNSYHAYFNENNEKIPYTMVRSLEHLKAPQGVFNNPFATGGYLWAILQGIKDGSIPKEKVVLLFDFDETIYNRHAVYEF